MELTHTWCGDVVQRRGVRSPVLMFRTAAKLCQVYSPTYVGERFKSANRLLKVIV